MKIKNMSKKLIFIVLGLMVGMILLLSACGGSAPGSRLLSGQGSNSIYAHGQTFNNVREISTFPDPAGQLGLRFVHKGEPHWCFVAGCIRGMNSADIGSTTN